MVTMYGPAFTAEGKIVEREVPEADVVAFQQAGYTKGKMPEGLAPVPRPSMAVEPEPVETDLDKMTKAELLAEAERRDVVVSSSETKAEIIEALNAAE